MSDDQFRRELNNAFDEVSGAPSSHLRDRVRARLADAPKHREPYWLAGVAAVVMAVLIVGVLYVANPFRTPRNSAGVGPTPSPSASPLTTPQPSASASPSAQPFVCTTQDFVPKSGSGTSPPVVFVSGLRTGTHGDYDRLTIDLSNGVPGDVKISSVSGTTYTLSPSGMTTTVKGQNSVLVVIHGADLHTAYSGPTDIFPGYAGLMEVKRIEDFEGTVQLVLGVSGSGCYRAFFLSNPDRLVIDVQAR